MAVTNMHFMKNASNLKLNCEVCAEGKHSRSSFPVNGSRASELLEVIHSDVCGPMSTVSLGGNKYYVSFIDDYSRMTKVYMIKNKSQVFDCFVKYKNLVENQLNRKIKKIRSDNGGEYCNAKFQRLCDESGIIHQKSCPHTPQQNGLAERYNRTIIERARCMLFDSKLSRVFWAEAVLTAVVIMNSTLNSAISAFLKKFGRAKRLIYLRFEFLVVRRWPKYLTVCVENSIKNQRIAFLLAMPKIKRGID